MWDFPDGVRMNLPGVRMNLPGVGVDVDGVGSEMEVCRMLPRRL